MLFSMDVVGLVLIVVAVVLVVILLVFTVISSNKNKKNKEIQERIAKEKAEAEKAALASSYEKIKEPEEVKSYEEEPKKEENSPEETILDEPEQETIEELEDEEESSEDEETVEDEEVEETVDAEEETESAEEAEDDEEEPAEDAPTPRTGRYAGKYVIMCEDDMYRYRLFASNGQPLVISEPYTTEKGCRNGILTLKKNLTDGTIDVSADKHNMWQFHLVSKQNRILAQSANYSSKDSAESAAKSFKKFALTENVVFDENMKGVNSVSEIAEDVEYTSELNGKYEILKNETGYVYILKASNGVKICESQTYKIYNSCRDAIERFKEAVYDGEFMIFKDKNDNFQFKLYSTAKRLVCVGEVYQTKAQVLKTITSIKTFAKDAILVEDDSDEDDE